MKAARNPMREHVEDLLPFYANATLPLEQQRAVEAHLPGCARCRAALWGWEELAGALRSITPPRGRAGRLPSLSPVVRASLRGKPSFPEAVLAAASLIAAQRIYLKENRLVQTVCAVFLAGVLAGLFPPGRSTSLAAAPFFLMVPLLAVLVIGFLESREDGPVSEIVAAAPTRPGVLTFARLTLALGVIAGLALAGSLLISVFGGFALGWLVLAWLGPLLWLSALNTLLALLLNPRAAAGISVTLWGAVALLLVTGDYGSSLLGFSLAPLLYPGWWSFGVQALLAGFLWLTCWLWLDWGAPPALRLESGG